MAIKITPADKWFSMCVRLRAGWKCERCGSQPDRRGLHCSHFHGRGKWAVRFDPDNAEALCMGCHLYLTANPAEHRARMALKLGPWRFEALQERANDAGRGRVARRDQKAVAAHYRRLYADMLKTDSRDLIGYI